MQLLEHFKELSMHPNNAKKLKGLILQLAIQGKLTAQWRKENPSTEPASELLERIKKEKIQLIKDKKIKKEKNLFAISEDEIPYELPDGWNWCHLNNLGLIGSSSRVLKKDWQSQGVPFYRAREIVKLSKFGMVNNDLYISEDLYNKHSINGIVPEYNDIMLTGVGTIGVPYRVKRNEKFYFKDASVLIFKNIFNLYPEFLNLIFLSKHWIDAVHKNSMGTTVHTLTISRAKQVIVPYPPLAEQKAIVSTVELLFKGVKQLEELTEKRIDLKEQFATSSLKDLSEKNTSEEWTFLQPYFNSFFTERSNLKKLRENILQLAVQGKLTTHWRTENPDMKHASVLLKRIKAEKTQLVKEKKIKKEKPLPKITEDEIPYTLPEGWVWCRLSELTKLITKGSSPKWQGVQYVGEGEGILFVTSENVGSYKLIWKKKKYVESKFNEIEPRSILKRNDLLMNIVGGSIGRTAIYNIDELANINQAVTIIRLLPKVSFDYFLHFFNSPTCISYMYDKQVDNARPNLSMGNISKFLIPLPSLQEQKSIVDKVNALMGLCDNLEKEIEISKATQEDWMKSSLREVFN